MSGDLPLEVIGALIVVLIVVGSVIQGNAEIKKANKEAKLHQMFYNQEGFNASQYLIKFPSFTSIPVGIAIDDQSKQICLINDESLRLIKYGDIIESVIIAEGDIITKTSRASQFAGAAIGGLLLGGVGAVIGGLSGKKVANQDVKDVCLKLLINDTSNPVHVIDFIETTDKGQQTEPKVALKEAQKWHDLVSVIIKQAEQEAEFKLVGQPGTIQSSFAEQISQLSELHKTGALTDDEFTNAKKKLLS